MPYDDSVLRVELSGEVSAEARAMLRRQQSCRKLQRFWRAMYESQLTTHHLASAFIRTGIPRVTALAAPAAPASQSRGAAVSAPIPMPNKRNGGRPPLPVPEAEATYTAARPMQSTAQGPQPPATPESSPARQRPGLRRQPVQGPAIAVLRPHSTLINAPEVGHSSQEHHNVLLAAQRTCGSHLIRQ
jgi:hypothetical protein